MADIELSERPTVETELPNTLWYTEIKQRFFTNGNTATSFKLLRVMAVKGSVALCVEFASRRIPAIEHVPIEHFFSPISPYEYAGTYGEVQRVAVAGRLVRFSNQAFMVIDGLDESGITCVEEIRVRPPHNIRWPFVRHLHVATAEETQEHMRLVALSRMEAEARPEPPAAPPPSEEPAEATGPSVWARLEETEGESDAAAES